MPRTTTSTQFCTGVIGHKIISSIIDDRRSTVILRRCTVYIAGVMVVIVDQSLNSSRSLSPSRARALSFFFSLFSRSLFLCLTQQHTVSHSNTQQHTATHHNTLQHSVCECHVLGLDSYKTAPHCTTLHHIASHCNTLQHTATLCNTLQHTAIHCNMYECAAHCNTLQHA